MRKILAMGAVLGLAGLAWWLLSAPSILNPQPSSTTATSSPELTQGYGNSAYNFSLKMPADFAAAETPTADGSGETVVLQNQSGDGIQIVISPFDEDAGSGYTLTKERILQDVPDLTITQEQPVNIGSNYTGLAFRSDNEVWGGDSREVWFVFKGNLYQISTYARLDPLLKAIFKTWNFQ